MTTILSHEAFHESIGFAFGEMLVLEQISQLPAESVLRVLQSIPTPLLRDALSGRQAEAPHAHSSGNAAERRASPRRKVLRGGQVMLGRSGAVAVQVRDVSEGGCRIWSRDPSGLPDRFTIRIVGFPGERPCDVRWRSGEELGLRFLDA